MPISKEQLFATADALLAEGAEPTLEAIRSKLGVATPPPTDVIAETKAMNDWKLDYAAKQQRAGESVPAAIGERVNRFSNDLWATALAHANQLIEPERKAIESARVEFETRQRQANSDAQALQTQLAAANERATIASARANELEKTVAALREKLNYVSEENKEMITAIKATVSIVNEP